MLSSGSTWLFNVVAESLRRAAKGQRVAAFFANVPASFPAEAADANWLLVKNHQPEAELVRHAIAAGGTIVATVREPRDAAASLMTRFSVDFDYAERVVAASAAALAQLTRARTHLLLRYEDRFFDDPATVPAVASALGLRIAPAAAQRIFQQFTPRLVTRKIGELGRSGAFDPALEPADQFDPATHWHPGHVGDRAVGKFATVLSAAQQVRIAEATRDYCREFGYPAA